MHVERIATQMLKAQAALKSGATLEAYFAKHRTPAAAREIIEQTVGGVRKSGVAGSDLEDAYNTASGALFTPRLATRSVLDALIANGATMVPYRTKLLANGAAAVPAWRTNGAALKAVRADFTGSTMPTKRIGAFAVTTGEALQDADPATEAAIERDITLAIDDVVSDAVIDPDNAGNATIPASLTHGATTIHSSGSAIANIATDLNAIQREMMDLGSDGSGLVYVMHGRTASHLSAIRGTNGERPFPDVTPSGGKLNGIPVISTNAVPNGGSPTSTSIALIAAPDVAVCDRGTVATFSDVAMIELDDAPTGNSVTPAAATATLISAFQSDLAVIKVTRDANWALRRGLVVVLDNIAY